MKIIVDPRIRFNYATWYLLGFQKMAGKQNIQFSVEPFEQLSFDTNQKYDKGMPCIVEMEDSQKIKCFIDFHDGASIEESFYEWCDVYAKINPFDGDFDTHTKLLAIGPSFGIRLSSLVHTMSLAFKNIVIKSNDKKYNPKLMFRDYLYPYIRRKYLRDYEKPVAVRKNYVFHASTLWYSETEDRMTNPCRVAFIRACREAGLIVEGGMFLLGDEVIASFPKYATYKEIYKDVIFTERLPMRLYVKGTKESVVVFNTPTVSDCHGWKLAEYLCMGKAIISMPLTRALPGEGLVHGESIHFVNSPDEIKEAVCKIVQDDAYRQKLEAGAKAYYQKYLAPEVVVQRIIDFAKNKV